MSSNLQPVAPASLNSAPTRYRYKMAPVNLNTDTTTEMAGDATNATMSANDDTINITDVDVSDVEVTVIRIKNLSDFSGLIPRDFKALGAVLEEDTTGRFDFNFSIPSEKLATRDASFKNYYQKCATFGCIITDETDEDGQAKVIALCVDAGPKKERRVQSAMCLTTPFDAETAAPPAVTVLRPRASDDTATPVNTEKLIPLQVALPNFTIYEDDGESTITPEKMNYRDDSDTIVPLRKATSPAAATSTKENGALFASLKPPKPVEKSAKPLTVPVKRIPGSNVERRLQETKEARLARKLNSELPKPKAKKEPYVPKSSRLPIPTFELPGDAIHRRAQEDRKLKREQEARRLQEACKPIHPRPVPKFAAPTIALRETKTSIVRKNFILSKSREDSEQGSASFDHSLIDGSSIKLAHKLARASDIGAIITPEAKPITGHKKGGSLPVPVTTAKRVVDLNKWRRLPPKPEVALKIYCNRTERGDSIDPDLLSVLEESMIGNHPKRSLYSKY